MLRCLVLPVLLTLCVGCVGLGDGPTEQAESVGGTAWQRDAWVPPQDACSGAADLGDAGTGVVDGGEVAVDASLADAAQPDADSSPGEVAGDPGMFTGLWLPPGLTATYVVDQSEPGGVSSTSSIPGCINQRSQLGSNYCGNTVVERARTLTMAQGNTFAIRYRSESVVPAGQYFKVTGGDGSGVPAAIDVSLSVNYADFGPGSGRCRVSSVPGLQPLIVIGAANCPVLPNSRYYLNIRVNSPCSGATCRFKILEPASFTN